MKRATKILIVLLPFLAAMPSASAAGRIVVLNKALVKGPAITLGEVATFEGVPPNTRDALSSGNLGSAAPPGRSVTLTRAQMKGRLYNAGVDFSAYTVVIPERVVILTRAEIVPGSRIMQAAADAVSERLQSLWKESSARVEIIGAPADVTLPFGPSTLKAVFESRGNRYGPTHIRIEIQQDGRTMRKLEVGNYLRIMVSVLAAANDLARGATLTEADIKTVEADLATLKPGTLNAKAAPLGKRLSRNVQADDILTAAHIEIVPDIAAGDIVQLVARGAGFEIAMQVKALEKGSKGDIIRVLNAGSKQVLDARVVDAGTVELVNP